MHRGSVHPSTWGAAVRVTLQLEPCGGTQQGWGLASGWWFSSSRALLKVVTAFLLGLFLSLFFSHPFMFRFVLFLLMLGNI